MTLTFTDILIAVALFTCVPLQYFLVQNWGNSESSRSYALNKFLKDLAECRDKFLDLGLRHLFPPTSPAERDPDHGESPAVEVMRYKHKYRYFSFSPEPRSYRPPSVAFRIGQVVQHKKWKYKGVIIGWDEEAKAPPEWFEEMHGKDNKEWKEMPNYTILVDTRDRLSPQLTYVPQAYIRTLKKTQIIHPSLDHHFESYDGDQYNPRPWLRQLYPRD